MIQPLTFLNDKFDALRHAHAQLTDEINSLYNVGLKFKKLRPDAVAPFQATDGSAGLDITGLSSQFDPGLVTYSTGIAVEIPEGYVGLLFPRSSVKDRPLSLANSVGVIDSDYRGEIKVVFRLLSDSNSGKGLYGYGDKICQLVLLKVPTITVEEVSELTSTVRGKGGFGSTGT